MTVADLVAKLTLKSDKAAFAAGDRLIGGIKKAAAGLAVFMTVDWFKSTIQGTIDLAGSLNDLAPQFGVTTDVLQELGAAGSQFGVEMSGIGAALKKMSINAGSTSKDVQKSFKKAGISTKDLLNGTLSTDKALSILANKFKSMPDGPEKIGLAMDILGRGGMTMIPMLNAGGVELDALRKKFVDLGGRIESDTITALDDLGDKQGQLQWAWQGMKNQLATKLAPAMNMAADKIMDWVTANKDLIKTKIDIFIEKAYKVAERLWEILQEVWKTAKNLWPQFMSIANTIGDVIKAVGGLENAIKIMMGSWIAFKGIGLMVFLGQLAAKLGAVAVASAAAGKGGIAAGAAFGATGLVVAVGAAAFAIGTLIDKVFDLSGKLSNLAIDLFGDNVFGQQSEASEKNRARGEQFKSMSDEDLRAQTRDPDKKQARYAFQELASRSSARASTRPVAATRAVPPAGAGAVVGDTSVTVNVTGAGDPVVAAKEMEKAADRVLNKRLKQARVGVR